VQANAALQIHFSGGDQGDKPGVSSDDQGVEHLVDALKLQMALVFQASGQRFIERADGKARQLLSSIKDATCRTT
jgi:hypothetical protein